MRIYLVKEYIWREMDVRFIHPFTCVVAGPTGSGKSVFIDKLVRNASDMIAPPPEKIIWCYGVWQNMYSEMAGVYFVEGLPDIKEIDFSKRHLIIIDDLMKETDGRVTQLFTKYSHHSNASVVYIIQNVFDKNKENRTISLNSHYLVLFKNPRDATQIVNLAKQMYPGQNRFLKEAYADATSRPYGYLLIDLKQNTPDSVRIRTNIFPDETCAVYVPKNP